MESSDWNSVWHVRAQVYALLGNGLLKAPDARIAACLRPGFWEQFPLETLNPHLQTGLAGLAEVAVELGALTEDAAVHALAADYTQLFVGPGAPPAPLWESLYREGGKFLFGTPTFDMRQLFRDHGMKLDESIHQLEDHIGVELLYLAKSAERFADTPPTRQDVEGQIAFIDDHLLWWIPQLREKTAAHAKLSFYPALIELAHGVLLWDKGLLGEYCAALDE